MEQNPFLRTSITFLLEVRLEDYELRIPFCNKLLAWVERLFRVYMSQYKVYLWSPSLICKNGFMLVDVAERDGMKGANDFSISQEKLC